MRPRTITLLAGLSLAIPGTFGSFSIGGPTILRMGGPTIFAPLPALVVLPSFPLGIPVFFLPMLIFFAWTPGLLRGETTVPRRTVVLFVSLVALTIVWFALGWNFGLQYQGRVYTWTVLAINAVWIVVLASLLVRFWKRESFAWSLTIHWLLFAWLAWFAFPYLGELP